MHKNSIRSITYFLAGLLMGVLLMIQIPRMLKAQREHYHHPDYMPGAMIKTEC